MSKLRQVLLASLLILNTRTSIAFSPRAPLLTRSIVTNRNPIETAVGKNNYLHKMGKKKADSIDEEEEKTLSSPSKKAKKVDEKGNDDDDVEDSKSKKPKKDPEPIARDPIAPKELVPGGKYLKIISWNVAGLRAVVKSNLPLLHRLIDTHAPDVLCLQETKLQIDHVKDFSDLLQDRGYISHWTCSIEKKGYSGCVCFVRKSLCDEKLNSSSSSNTTSSSSSTTTQKQKSLTSFFTSKSSSGPSASTSSQAVTQQTEESVVSKLKCIELDFPTPKHKGEGRAITVEFDQFILVNCYVPNSGQNLERLSYRLNEFDPMLREYLQSLESTRQKPVILAGDLNCGHLDDDIHNPTAKHIVKQAGLTPGERKSFGQLLSAGFVDAFRHFHPTSRGHFTYWSQRAGNRPPNRGIRLDYFIASKSMATQDGVSLFDCYHLPEDTVGCSDHAPIVLVLSL